MKKKVTDFVRALEGITFYSGKTRTMHISKAPFSADIEMKIIEKFGYNLPFKLSTNL